MSFVPQKCQTIVYNYPCEAPTPFLTSKIAPAPNTDFIGAFFPQDYTWWIRVRFLTFFAPDTIFYNWKTISRKLILPSSISARGTLHCSQFLRNSCLGINKKHCLYLFTKFATLPFQNYEFCTSHSDSYKNNYHYNYYWCYYYHYYLCLRTPPFKT